MAIETRGIIVVPDLSAVDLIALLKKECKPTIIDEDYETWNVWKDSEGRLIRGRGQTFEYVTWSPGQPSPSIVSSDKVRRHFQRNGFYGHAGAFNAWILQNKPDGFCASILEHTAYWRDACGNLYNPYSCFDGTYRKMGHHWAGADWSEFYSFIAFRER